MSVREPTRCRFDFPNGNRGVLQCQVERDHVLRAYADPAGRASLLRSLYDRGQLVGEALREVRK